MSQRKKGTQFVSLAEESEDSITYRQHMNSQGSPTEIVAGDCRWLPGTGGSARALSPSDRAAVKAR